MVYKYPQNRSKLRASRRCCHCQSVQQLASSGNSSTPALAIVAPIRASRSGSAPSSSIKNDCNAAGNGSSRHDSEMVRSPVRVWSAGPLPIALLFTFPTPPPPPPSSSSWSPISIGTASLRMSTERQAVAVSIESNAVSSKSFSCASKWTRVSGGSDAVACYMVLKKEKVISHLNIFLNNYRIMGKERMQMEW